MRRAVLLILATGLASLGFNGAIAGSAWAQAAKTPVSFVDSTTLSVPGRAWVSGHVFHLRQEVDTGTVHGDLEGTITLRVNINTDLHTGRGVVFGKFWLSAADVTWTGSFNGKLTSDASRGRFIGQGSDGSKLMGTFTQIAPGTDQDEAIILSPHG
jgi:hypothetical protein